MKNLTPLKESNSSRTSVCLSPLKTDQSTMSIFNLIQEQLNQHTKTISQQSIEQHKLKLESLENEYQEQLKEKSYEIQELKKVNAILNREVENIQHQLTLSERNLEQQDQNYQLQILNAEDGIKSLNIIIARQVETIQGLQKQKESLQVIVENEKNLGKVKDRENHLLQEMVQEQQQKMTSDQILKQEIQTLSYKLNAEQNLNNQLQSRLDYLNRIDSPYQQIRGLTEKLDKTIKDLKGKEDLLNDINNQLSQVIEENAFLKEQNDLFSDQLSDLTKDKMVLEESLQAGIEKLEQQVNKNDIDQLRITELTQQMESTSDQLEQTYQMLVETQQLLSKAKESEQKVKESYRQAMIRIEGFNTKIITQDTLEFKLKAVSQQLSDKAQEICDLKNEIKSLKVNCDGATQQVRLQLQNAQDQLCEMKFEYQEVLQIKQNQSRQLEQLKEKCSQLTAQIDLMNFFKLRNIELEVKNQQLQTECDKNLQKKKSKDLSESNEEKIHELEAKLTRQNTEMTNLIDELQAVKQKLSQNEHEYERNQRDMIQKHKTQIQEIMNSSQVELENIRARMENTEKAKRAAVISKRSFLN